MTNLHNLSVEQLRRVVAIKEKIDQLQTKLDAVTDGGTPARTSKIHPVRRRRTMSRAARARIAAAQRARWAKLKRKRPASHAPSPRKKKKRVVDEATRARLATIARARWARVK